MHLKTKKWYFHSLTLVARLRDRNTEVKMTIDKIKILKINRHLFDKGTSKDQGIAVLCPKRFDSSFALDAMCGYTPACHADKEKVKNRVEILNLNLSLQNKGYRLDSLAKLKMFSLEFGVFYLLLFSNFITNIYGNF